MFPDKVGLFVLDGVVDGYKYRDSLWSSHLVHTEEVIDSLFTFCHQAGPIQCPIYESTPALIRARYFRTLDAIKLSPVPVIRANPPIVITHKVLTIQLAMAAFAPVQGFRLVATTIRALERDDQYALSQYVANWLQPQAICFCDAEIKPWIGQNEALYAIGCGDKPGPAEFDMDAFTKAYEGLVMDSPHTGALWAGYRLRCAEWPTRAAWRYTGPLEAEGENATAVPMLIVQPRWDPVCPLQDVRAVRERYEGAAMLVQESYGHCSISAPSVCTARRVRAYFQDGELPEEGAVCEVDEVPFVGRVRADAIDTEEAELVWATRKLVEAVPRFNGML